MKVLKEGDKGDLIRCYYSNRKDRCGAERRGKE